MCRPRPLAVGLVHQSASALPTERRQARIALSLFANAEGYALVETFEVDGSAPRDAATLLALEELAQRVEAVALIVSGDVDREKIEAIAEWVRMVVLVRTQAGGRSVSATTKSPPQPVTEGPLSPQS